MLRKHKLLHTSITHPESYPREAHSTWCGKRKEKHKCDRWYVKRKNYVNCSGHMGSKTHNCLRNVMNVWSGAWPVYPLQRKEGYRKMNTPISRFTRRYVFENNRVNKKHVNQNMKLPLKQCNKQILGSSPQSCSLFLHFSLLLSWTFFLISNVE